MDDRLKEIKARCEAATPGPWEVGYSSLGGMTVVNVRGSEFPCWKTQIYKDDAEFIAHARQDVPWLVAEVERLRAELAVGRAIIKGIFEGIEP